MKNWQKYTLWGLGAIAVIALLVYANKNYTVNGTPAEAKPVTERNRCLASGGQFINGVCVHTSANAGGPAY